mgnify:CR=1 FL=1
MEKIQFDLAGEYLVMAAYLTEIKSRMMLPKESDSEDEEDDPRSVSYTHLTLPTSDLV